MGLGLAGLATAAPQKLYQTIQVDSQNIGLVGISGTTLLYRQGGKIYNFSLKRQQLAGEVRGVQIIESVFVLGNDFYFSDYKTRMLYRYSAGKLKALVNLAGLLDNPYIYPVGAYKNKLILKGTGYAGGRCDLISGFDLKSNQFIWFYKYNSPSCEAKTYSIPGESVMYPAPVRVGPRLLLGRTSGKLSGPLALDQNKGLIAVLGGKQPTVQPGDYRGHISPQCRRVPDSSGDGSRPLYESLSTAIVLHQAHSYYDLQIRSVYDCPKVRIVDYFYRASAASEQAEELALFR
jgi:hypothetical protein